MGRIKRFIANQFGDEIKAAANELFEARLKGLDVDEAYWEELGGAALRDLDPDTRRKVDEEVWRAYKWHPFARRHVKALTGRLVGKGLAIEAADQKYVQPFLDEFTATNHFGLRLREGSNRLILSGELFWPLFISKSDGSSRLREYDPREIVDVVTDSDDYLKIMGYVRQCTRRTFDQASFTYHSDPQKKEFLEPIQYLGPNTGTIREIIFVKALSVATNPRGESDLQSYVFFLRQHKLLLKYRVELNKARLAYAWMCTLKGGRAEDVIKKRKEFKLRGAPPPGQVYVKTDAEDMEALAPKVGGGDASKDIRGLALMAVSASGVPEHILIGDASNANYSSTESAKEDWKNTIEEYQEFWEVVLKRVFGRVIAWGKRYGPIPNSADDGVDITFPTPPGKHMKEAAETVAVYRDHDLASRDTCRGLVGLDPGREKQKLEEEDEEENSRAGGGDY
ncbi:MAG: hypothetical protein V3W11_12460 [bacterium]